MRSSRGHQYEGTLDGRAQGFKLALAKLVRAVGGPRGDQHGDKYDYGIHAVKLGVDFFRDEALQAENPTECGLNDGARDVSGMGPPEALSGTGNWAVV